jgi:hypothetical protein
VWSYHVFGLSLRDVDESHVNGGAMRRLPEVVMHHDDARAQPWRKHRPEF